jgi:putative ABC transport system permease protein
MRNIKVVLRGLARSPLFAAVAVVSLALGIGVNTAIFSLLDQVLLRTLPLPNPHELVYLYHPGPVQGSSSTDEQDMPSFSYPMFRDLQKQQTPFTALGASRSTGVSLSYKNNASPARGRAVSGNYFEILGVRPAIGRLFTDDDDRTPGGHPVAVLGYAYWSRQHGADVSVLNQTVMVNARPMTIVGVAQKGFGSESLGSAPDVFFPISMDQEIEGRPLQDRKNYWVTLFGRLKSGMTRQRAETEINVPYRAGLLQDEELLQQPRADFLARFRAKKIILKEGQYGRGGMRDQGRGPLQLLMGLAILVLLIACANVANLQLARSTARSREMGIRLAMGASRGQLVRQLLMESCLLAVAGGALGLVLARWTIRAILVAIPSSRGFGALTDSLDLRVLGFSLGISVLTGVLFGLFPALQASKASLVTSIKDQAGQISASGSANLFRSILATAQIAISLMLLICAGLFGRTLVNLSRIDLGIRTDHLMTFALMPRLNQYTDARTAQFYEQMTQRLAAIPGATVVTAAQVPVIAGSNSSTSISVEGYVAPGDSGAQSNYNVIGPDFFRTLGQPLIAGREFTMADSATAPKVAIVNEAFARFFFGNQNPIGRRLARNGAANAPKDIEIVGVAKDSKYSDIKVAPPPVFYTPMPQSTRWGQLFFYVRTGIDPERIANLIRREVTALDPNLPIRDLKTMDAQIEENTFGERILSTLTASFAGLATILAAVGLYGVLAFNVARRTREIGIRMALGAGAGQVRLLIGREVGLMLALGTAVGLGGAFASGKFVATFLFGLKPMDAFVYSAAALVLWAVALAAAYVPSRRATKIDPMVALRYE